MLLPRIVNEIEPVPAMFTRTDALTVGELKVRATVSVPRALLVLATRAPSTLDPERILQERDDCETHNDASEAVLPTFIAREDAQALLPEPNTVTEVEPVDGPLDETVLLVVRSFQLKKRLRD